VTIDYTYDPLYRLSAADYSTGDFYHYAYDSVGNRLTQENMVHGLPLTDTYAYDESNRLMEVDGISYTWDANGNLLDDGSNTYTYDSANRLVDLNGTTSYAYNGLGDRLTQNGTHYTLDLNSGLTQVLSDETHSYTYGLGRISQQSGIASEYFLGDALGSVRQMTDQAGAIIYAASYNPYGVVTQSSGAGQSAYGFTGEQQDVSGMVYLRARYYSPGDGRFLNRDTWGGDGMRPMSFGKWQYVYSNPINLTDPTGNFPLYCHKMGTRLEFEDCVRKAYGLARPLQYGLWPNITANDSPGCHYEVSPEFPIPYDGQGYLEGHGDVTLGYATASELVFDFTTMSSALFDVKGVTISDSLLGFGPNTYFGIIGDTLGNGFSSQRSINDYGGYSVSDFFGFDIPTALIIISTPGAYKSSFMSLSLNPIMGHTWGDFWGASIDPIPFLSIGASVTKSTIRPASIKEYTLRDRSGYEYVDIAMLRRNIIMGFESPWNEAGILFYTPLLPARLYALTMVDKWAKIYEELHNGE
jgi:RHS repeat-associated protein